LLNNLIGKPWVKNGDGSNGFDCFTLAQEVLKRKGIILPSNIFIADLVLRDLKFNKDLDDHFIKLPGAVDFCIVVFSLRAPYITHMGVVIERNKFIHVLEKRHVCIERLNHYYWQKRIKGYYHYGG